VRKALPGLNEGTDLQVVAEAWSFSPSGRYALIPSVILSSRFVSLVNVESGASSPILKFLDAPQVNLYLASFSPAGNRIYFTSKSNVSIDTVALDAVTKRPTGAATTVLKLNTDWSLRGLMPGSFRLAISRNKLPFALGRRNALVEYVH